MVADGTEVKTWNPMAIPLPAPKRQRAGMVTLHRRVFRPNQTKDTVWVRAADVQIVECRYSDGDGGPVGSRLVLAGGAELLVTEPPDAVLYSLEHAQDADQ